MRRRQTMMGTLLTAFRNAKSQASHDGKQALWKRNKLENPAKRHDYEIREVVVSNGSSTEIVLQLWKKVDSQHMRITADVKSGEVKKEESIEELMK